MDFKVTHKHTNTQTFQVIIRANFEKDCHVQYWLLLIVFLLKKLFIILQIYKNSIRKGLCFKPGEDTISLSSVLYRKIVFIWEMKMEIKFHQTMKFKF